MMSWVEEAVDGKGGAQGLRKEYGALRLRGTIVRSEWQEEEKSPHCQLLLPVNLDIFTKSTHS